MVNLASLRMADQELAQVYGRREAGMIPVFAPGEFGYHCPEGHTDDHLTWSEFKEHIWCFACRKDYHYAEDCYLVRPWWMSSNQWDEFLKTLPQKPEIRSGA